MTDEQKRDLVKECGLDWQRGYMPLFDDDPTNRYAVLIDAAVAAERERCATTQIDYKAAIYHCHENLGHEQGTKGCVAFARGAEWALAQLLKAPAGEKT